MIYQNIAFKSNIMFDMVKPTRLHLFFKNFPKTHHFLTLPHTLLLQCSKIAKKGERNDKDI